MTGGGVWSTLFFLLLFLASLTSTRSMSEISISFLAEENKLGRKSSTVISCGITLFLSLLCALSMGPWHDFKIFGLNFFNLFDYVASNILMPIGGMVCSIFAGWWIDSRFIRDQLTNGSERPLLWLRPLIFFLRWICPAAIFIIFLDSVGII